MSIDFSFGTEAEKSTIKPNLPGYPSESDATSAAKGLKFKYNTLTFDSYAKEGFRPPELYKRDDKFEVRFLAAVDITKSKIKVEITNMIRLQAIDYSSPGQEYKDYLYFTSNWYAKNWREEELKVIGHIEGKHIEQTRRLRYGPQNQATGKIEPYYEKGQARDTYSIPFTKKNVDFYLYGEHPFGADSINITNPNKVIFYGRIEHVLGVPSFRCADFTYQQFIEPEWKKFMELAIQSGGPAKRKPQQEREIYG